MGPGATHRLSPSLPPSEPLVPLGAVLADISLATEDNDILTADDTNPRLDVDIEVDLRPHLRLLFSRRRGLQNTMQQLLDLDRLLCGRGRSEIHIVAMAHDATGGVYDDGLLDRLLADWFNCRGPESCRIDSGRIKVGREQGVEKGPSLGGGEGHRCGTGIGCRNYHDGRVGRWTVGGRLGGV